ncbi:hypothetical protein DXD45_08320 [Bifidobacterium bifidum]|nr:hypothetical protein DXD45_08320 [Bifidobacterium bifidum]
MEFDCATAVSDMFDCMHTSRDSGGGRPISAAAARPPLRPFGDTAPAGIHGKTMKPHTVYRPCGQHDCCRSRRKSRRI